MSSRWLPRSTTCLLSPAPLQLDFIAASLIDKCPRCLQTPPSVLMGIGNAKSGTELGMATRCTSRLQINKLCRAGVYRHSPPWSGRPCPLSGPGWRLPTASHSARCFNFNHVIICLLSRKQMAVMPLSPLPPAMSEPCLQLCSW